jgi:hypothetical protein
MISVEDLKEARIIQIKGIKVAAQPAIRRP